MLIKQHSLAEIGVVNRPVAIPDRQLTEEAKGEEGHGHRLTTIARAKASREAIWFIDLDDAATDIFVKISAHEVMAPAHVCLARIMKITKEWRMVKSYSRKGTNLSNKRLR